jgi:hypothetical protein
MRHPQEPSLHVTIGGPDRGQAFRRGRAGMSPMLPVVGVLRVRRGRKGRCYEHHADYQCDLAHLLTSPIVRTLADSGAGYYSPSPEHRANQLPIRRRVRRSLPAHMGCADICKPTGPASIDHRKGPADLGLVRAVRPVGAVAPRSRYRALQPPLWRRRCQAARAPAKSAAHR